MSELHPLNPPLEGEDAPSGDPGAITNPALETPDGADTTAAAGAAIVNPSLTGGGSTDADSAPNGDDHGNPSLDPPDAAPTTPGP